MTTTLLARPFRGRNAHLVLAQEGVAPVTLCGLDARLMARWSPSDAGADRKAWPICPTCRAARA